MDNTPGVPSAECFDKLTYAQKQRTTDGIAQVMRSLYSITATHCGSLQVDLSLRTGERAVRYGGPPRDLPSVTNVTASGRFVVGPANEFVFMEFPDARLAPLVRAVLVRTPVHGGPHFVVFSRTPASIEKLVWWLFEKALEVSDAIHFCHGDIATSNIPLDLSTGSITAVLNWEVAGFRPPCAAAAAGAWFNDDKQRFVMCSNNDASEVYAEDAEDDQELRRYFLGAVGERSHLVHRIELCAMYTIVAEESAMEVIE